jgi:hypothetical protein
MSPVVLQLFPILAAQVAGSSCPLKLATNLINTKECDHLFTLTFTGMLIKEILSSNFHTPILIMEIL